ncbi:hypothetical protein [Saccharomonospora saliphila]|uniref:hypothetical protein n=1 Tax=Saccharomonospora saliphila TaxID=369829 RepID=UPI0003A0308A|nr:hypothetical protein [Saccharomonospora saliphila]
MTRGRRGVRTGAAWSLVIAFVAVATLVSLRERQPDPPLEPVSVGEAEALLATAVRHTRDGDFPGLCRAIAHERHICDVLLRSAWERDHVPDDSAPEVVTVTRPTEHTVRLHLRGAHADGGTYRTEFVVYRATGGEHAGETRSPTPVYWSPMTLNPPGVTCTADNGHRRCGGRAVAPDVSSTS